MLVLGGAAAGAEVCTETAANLLKDRNCDFADGKDGWIVSRGAASVRAGGRLEFAATGDGLFPFSVVIGTTCLQQGFSPGDALAFHFSAKTRGSSGHWCVAEVEARRNCGPGYARAGRQRSPLMTDMPAGAWRGASGEMLVPKGAKSLRMILACFSHRPFVVSFDDVVLRRKPREGPGPDHGPTARDPTRRP